MKTVLTIAGSDCSGGAGIQADLKTIEAHGMYGMSVITALTAQNTLGISGIMVVKAEFVKKQLDAIFDDIRPDAIKIGMLPDADVMKAVRDVLVANKASNIVLDPVLGSTSGTELSKKEAREFLKNELFCLCDLVTPNIPEAEILSGRKIGSKKDMEEVAMFLSEEYDCSFLVKGGHSSFDSEDEACDCLYQKNPIFIEGKRIDNPNTHGTGCTLSSAIACNLAEGLSMEESVKRAKEYIEKCISARLDIGRGRGPLLHNLK
ncbi:hydroxymethylpyrimidine/phosphomethylpyrimidine kinase [Butyrivibrio proteoclasticus]|uniref:Hydroxymethylpyrimidine/phosphomethylpyrimidine kinase n=1 Tax=Butyrivibrio proteoclasticus TaxID=43305 RepID=A0A1I5RQI6_9FIRM|nr:bifunctional hydroxymethylpyrimidine kinase/phosphomethylpyrimidine kinase [Butyrivibrio proteoclasticus]SFP60824.1 hydroxymethylpyrimidine/phosphomethylpyrimidine kinase [Butyrivibrio proteoclasticus]